MAEPITLEFIARQLDRVIADHAEFRDDMRVLTAIVLRHDNMLKDMLEQITAMVAQHRRFSDRLRELEEHSAQ
ncbi:MAG TPA: hypothetical protein VM782_24995 [Stellaceae bacterium]|nr:hypothetical protein [Stellaceae bacterium]